ncbi:MAG: hypothetical protein H6528_07130 [Actinobacteria bacterium]|nr:hypothetical protein [Actinomycetota bacterium]MCB8997051.1 hypothetical protein [Actinomycetota bacterium]MCB9425240.1 hypothetical protein [Actinomycetota bacterium]HRY09188.1 glycerophosphodiester phosphodiesterase family protein [Candidatus Nanopelagicales bacterium]
MTDRPQAEAALTASHRSVEDALTPGDAVVRLVAHRGSGHAHTDPLGPPENTLAGIEYGFAQGADAVEVDVWRTADGTIVLHHDATTDRTTDRAGIGIAEASYAELLELSAGRWKGASWSRSGIPTLAECTPVVPADRALVVEIEQGPQVVPDVLAASEALPPDRLMFISKNLDTAGAIKAAAPHYRTLWIVDTIPRWQIGGWAQGHRRGADSHRRGFDEPADVRWLVGQAVERGLDGLDTLFAYPPDLPEAIAAANLTWLVWTANDPRAVDACVHDGAWGITTDNTRQVHDWLVASGRSTAHAAGERY